MTKISFSCIESRMTTPRNMYATYKIGPFDKNHTLTIANNLRRALLCEIPGLAFVAAKINDASHEYISLPGVREPVLDILLNIKQIPLVSMFEVQAPCIAYLKVQGPCVVTAKDIKFPPFVRCVDPDQYITTLAPDGVIDAQFVICSGKNYWMQFSPAQLLDYCADAMAYDTKGATEKNEVSSEFLRSPNLLLIDAVFMPIKKVNYTIEVDDEIDTEKPLEHIFLQIWTNGSIHPNQAITLAASSLVELFQKFEAQLQASLAFFVPERLIIAPSSQYKDSETPHSAQAPFGGNPKLDLDIANLELSLRPYSCLKGANIETIFDLLKYSREELLLLKNFGKRSLEEVETALFHMGLELPVKKQKSKYN